MTGPWTKFSTMGKLASNPLINCRKDCKVSAYAISGKGSIYEKWSRIHKTIQILSRG